MIWLTILLITVITGIISGMFGIGGSIIATPLLILFTDISPNSALTTPLPVALSSSASGSLLYFREKLIDFRLAFLVLLFAIPFSLIGGYLTLFVNIHYLLSAKALFLLILGVRFLLSSNKTEIFETEDRKIANIAITGVIAGFIAGILALGGGIVFVTAFVKLLKVGLKKAIGTSLFCVLFLSLINTTSQLIFGTIKLDIALFMMLTVLPFSYLGAYLSVKIKNKTINLLFGSLLIIFSLYFIGNLFYE